MNKINKKILSVGFAVALCLPLSYGVLMGTVFAASLTNTYVRLDRMKASTATTVRLVFRVPAGNSQTEENLKVSVPDGFTVATSGQTGATAACATDTGATALPGTLVYAGNNTNGQKGLTITGITNLSASTSYCVDFTKSDALTNSTAGSHTATVETFTSGAALIDSTSVTLRVVSDDQVAVSATVPPSFNFVLDANTTSFTSNLGTGSVVQTTGRTLTITTNAPNGWIAWAKDANTGLTSAAASKTIASTTPGSAATLTAGNEGYVVSAEVTTNASGGGNPAIPAAYQGTGANDNGSGVDTTFRQIASSGGTANGDVITVRGKAAIDGATPSATDYTDTWTIIGAGTF